jgi:hypothetical protein
MRPGAKYQVSPWPRISPHHRTGAREDVGTKEAFEFSETHNEAHLILLLDDYF